MNNVLPFRVMVVGIALVLISISCSKDWLDEKSDKSLAVPLEASDFQAILDNFTKMNLSTVLLGEIASDDHYYADNDFNPYIGKIYENAYTWSKKVNYELVSDWNTPYSSILMLNIVLDGASKLQGTTIKNQLIGQALFQRSRLFFDLAWTFSTQYVESTASTSLGIPLRLNTEITAPSVQSTVKEVYDRIIDDLKTSIRLLPIVPDYLTRGSRTAALGLLGRVYLNMQQYDSALVYADKCISLRNLLLDYNTLPTNRQFIGINSEVLFSSFHSSINLMTSNYLIDSTLFASYASNDLRKILFFINSNGRIQFKGSYGNSATDVFTGVALDEVYLIKSECLVRLGKISEGMTVLNELLRTRWKKNGSGTSSYIDQNVSSETEALQIILKERRKQLVHRNLRWADLKRLNLDSRFSKTLNRALKGVLYELAPNSYQYVFPIPNDIIQKTSLKQNSGWQD